MYKIWKRLGLLKTSDTVEKTWLAKLASSVAFKALIIT